MDTGGRVFYIPSCILADSALRIWQDTECDDGFVWIFADSDFLKSGRRFVLPAFFVQQKSQHIVYNLE